MPDSIPLHHVLWIKDIRRPDLPPKPPPELIQGRMGAVIPGLHLDGGDLLPLCDKKVDLHMIFSMQIVAAGVEVKPVPIAPEHMGHDVFHDHALVDVQPVKKDRPVQLVVGEGGIHKGQGHQQTGIRHVALLGGVVRAEGQPHAGVGGVEAGVDHHGLIEPQKGILIGSETGDFVDGREGVLLILLGKLAGDAIEHGKDLFLIASGKLGNVVPVKAEDTPFGLIGGGKVFPVPVGQHRLRQPTHKDILPEVIHHLKVQGEHLNMLLLRGNDNVLGVLFPPNQRTSFQKVVSAIHHQVFDKLSCPGELLHLVKDDEGIPFVQVWWSKRRTAWQRTDPGLRFRREKDPECPRGRCRNR